MCEVNIPRQKVPKDGVGPRGVPECYYTSRVLNSTFRYVKFVRKLRALEEEQRKGAENKAKEAKDQSINEFFMRCDRRSLINDVARRVDLCLDSYQKDLEVKKERLKELFAREEEENTRKFVAQAQAGAELVWQDKKERLRFLLEKRKKEHAEKYKDTPLSKCVHVLPCILKLRAMEAQQIQLYQMKEKQARKMADIEFDKMWHEVTMKEADALAARMEYDAIERYRRDMECKQYSDYQLEQRRRQRENEREMLRQESLRFKAIWDAENKKEEDAEQARRDKAKQVAEDSNRFLRLNQERLARESEEEKMVSDAWNSLTHQGLAGDMAMIELRRRKERELDECNRRLLEMKKKFVDMDIEDDVIRKEDARLTQKKKDEVSCRYLKWAKETSREVRKGMIEQMKEREEEKKVLKKRIEEEDEYHRQLREQLDKLVEYRDKMDAKVRKDHQQNLVKQMEYNNILKERAKQEELDQVKKYAIATKEYEDEIEKMLCRPFFSDHIHPFMKQMAKGIKMAEKCPCFKKDYFK
ncbi:PREDICTED: trichohyalin-like [Papilio polytes]|uniref:trichohyalin-like n=1 Tax=Papilio polytes TaxID=76194 RepID=UPI000675EB60|nr:PREDICTED: trichohyalin-like [Papilio polytes]